MYICVFICTYISGSAPPVVNLLLHLISSHHFSGHRLRRLGFLFRHRTRTYVHTYNTNKHTYIHTHIHTYVHTYVRKYMHTYIHTYVHTQTYILGRKSGSELGRNWVATGSEFGAFQKRGFPICELLKKLATFWIVATSTYIHGLLEAFYWDLGASKMRLANP